MIELRESQLEKNIFFCGTAGLPNAIVEQVAKCMNNASWISKFVLKENSWEMKSIAVVFCQCKFIHILNPF